MRFTHTVGQALAAAALTVVLAAGAPAAQAAPVAAPVAHSQHVTVAHVAKKAAKARTKISATAPSKVKDGDDITFTAKLTKKSGSKYKAYAKQEVELVVLDERGGETGGVLDIKKTSKKGKVTFSLPTKDLNFAGQTFDFLIAYEGGSKAKASESSVLTVSITE